MRIYLLTHERELDRNTNTGAIALSVASGPEGVVQRIVWSRTSPNQNLLQLLAQGAVGLLYPLSEADGTEIGVDECEHFILLDATWQEARKIYNRSPYLKTVPRVNLRPEQESRYRLRRNQKSDGLCTAECVIQILQAKGKAALAAEVETAFDGFNSRAQ
ncbi:DTW domain-containing protein [Microbulbifer hydrolyticus]|uniref:tRNA-uridine aminocarboxypropyltransferase n=1 Tax=Microbulbifer hydrolyticus TaxID=48074 RepID=A0A6P1T8F6_9GAMM|nr:tRNA-uridine aminocarboxypropyltransferase [Microbulbifer hydrolyticus]MBB5211271.1 DTW domain-containing protein YfiP [Microbulbifer hydrolyticus]QHQ37963.1 DTW domain-containing protein [Microbulbifer hydrolyticus]